MKKHHPRHLALAQKVLDVAVERGMAQGDRMAEQALASLCNVSRTPIRKALQLLADRGLVLAEAQGGFVLGVDPVLTARLEASGRSGGDGEIHLAILRDLGAGRLPETQTVASLQRRYGASRQAVQNALLKLSEDGLAERGAGQQWLLKSFAVSADAIHESYDFRLAVEPLALTMPGFRRDFAMIASLRQAMLVLQGKGETAFDRRLFDRTDFDFHMLVARSAGNSFLSEALVNFHRRRATTMAGAAVTTFRLMKSNAEHLAILEQMERGQMELAADLMRVHIQLSRPLRPGLAGRGIPLGFKSGPPSVPDSAA